MFSMSKLPTRTTRGRRFRRVIEEEAEADEDFWNQDFFREEARDSDYESETEEDDVVDTDFSDKVPFPLSLFLKLSRNPLVVIAV